MRKPRATNTANLGRPKSWKTSARGLCPCRTQVLDNNFYVTYLAEQAIFALLGHCRQQPLPKEQPRWHTATDKEPLSLPVPAISNLILSRSGKLGPCGGAIFWPRDVPSKTMFSRTCPKPDVYVVRSTPRVLQFTCGSPAGGPTKSVTMRHDQAQRSRRSALSPQTHRQTSGHVTKMPQATHVAHPRALRQRPPHKRIPLTNGEGHHLDQCPSAIVAQARQFHRRRTGRCRKLQFRQ